MSTAIAFANSLLGLIYRAAAIADIADNDATSPATTLSIALHTGVPGATQATNEATYTSYARVTINRNGTDWTAPSGGSLSNASLIQFPSCTGGSNVITHVSIGYSSGTVIHYGALTASRTITDGTQPQFAASALVSMIT